jgi:uncharacterized membrane protein
MISVPLLLKYNEFTYAFSFFKFQIAFDLFYILTMSILCIATHTMANGMRDLVFIYVVIVASEIIQYLMIRKQIPWIITKLSIFESPAK